MKNHYLYIHKNKNGSVELNYSDGVFSGFAVVNNEKEFYEFCDSQANCWRGNFKYRNFDGWSENDRKIIAHKWLAAKELPEGKYEYYFNFGTIQDIFREEVAALASSLGITNYNLTVE